MFCDLILFFSCVDVTFDRCGETMENCPDCQKFYLVVMVVVLVVFVVVVVAVDRCLYTCIISYHTTCW